MQSEKQKNSTIILPRYKKSTKYALDDRVKAKSYYTLTESRRFQVLLK